MDPTDLLRARAREAYERGRLSRSIVFALPLGMIAVVACLLGAAPRTAGLCGATLVAAAALFLWRGRSLGRSVFPGVVAGLVPLACALTARSIGHVCTGERCLSMCVPACALGGFVAGLLLARAGRGAAQPVAFFLGGGGLTILVGALGCSCVGSGGVLGLAVGLATTLSPALLRSVPRGA